MRGFLKALVLVPVAAVIVLLSVANREPITLSLDPFSEGAPALSVTLPLFALILLALMLGVVVGGWATWLKQGKHRRAARGHRREADRLRAEIGRSRPPASGGLPVLPSKPPLA